ncbi:MAG: cupin domain-containing protein, partial [Clostridia bacterium]|nr:cupin domain-containing protein [Clostridia bacterium]
MPAFYETRQNNFYCRDSAYSKKTLGYTSHLHYHIEVALVKSGETRVTVDSTEYDVKAGDLIVVFPNQIHRFETVEREKYLLLIVNPDIISELIKPLTSTIPVSNLLKGGANDPEIVYLCEKISEAYHSECEWKDAVLRGYLLAFFGILLQKLPVKDIQSKESNVLGVILNYCIN